MPIIGATSIAESQDLQRDTLSVPEWGGDALIQEIDLPARIALRNWVKSSMVPDGEQPDSAASKAAIETALTDDPYAITGFLERLIALHLINEDGSLVYPDVEAGIVALRPRSATVKMRVAEACMTLSGLETLAVEKKADELPNSPSA